MKRSMKQVMVCLSALLFMPVHASAVTWIRGGSGKLIEARDVYVGGTLYDVEFLDGTCIDLFGGCDNASDDFTFTNKFDALAAANALSGQVFIDHPTYGNFDTEPALTNGITDAWQGNMYIPYTFDPTGAIPNRVYVAYFRNNTGTDSTEYGYTAKDTDFSSAGWEAYVWAKWSPAVVVPEPSTILLIGMGLGGLAGFRKKFRTE